MDIFEKLSLCGIVPVIKVEDANDAVPVCRALANGGLPVAEITFRTAAAAEAIENVKRELPDVLLGAGTVLSVEQVKAAVKAGASFIVSPGLNPEVVKYCVYNSIPVLPGCSGPSDVELAMSFGLKNVKFFPAEALGGLKLIKAMSAPYSGIKFVPTGGINKDNMNDYLSCPAVLAVGGSWMVPQDAILNKDWAAIEKLAKEAVAAMLGFDLVHFGVNSGSPEAAERDAKLFCDLLGWNIKMGNSSNFAGTRFEFMKKPYYGTHGHIAISCFSVERAVEYFRRLGYGVIEATAGYKNGHLNAIYLDGEFAGYAIHLLRK